MWLYVGVILDEWVAVCAHIVADQDPMCSWLQKRRPEGNSSGDQVEARRSLIDIGQVDVRIHICHGHGHRVAISLIEGSSYAMMTRDEDVLA